MLNRKKQPTVFEVEKIQLPPTEVFFLDNQIPVYVINLGLQEVVKVEMVFKAGRPFERSPLASRATNSLIKEGTLYQSSAEITEKIDFWGGTLTTPFGVDNSSVTLQCLTKHYPNLLPMLAEIIFSPAFSEKELDTFVENNVQNLQVELSKSETIAYRQITESIFGESHPYGYNSNEQLYRALRKEQLHAHHQENFTAANCSIFISGKVSNAMLQLLNQYFGKILLGKKNIYEAPNIKATPHAIFIEKKDSSQTAITIGRQLFTRNHQDYNPFFVLNTILGGYFGSRLMENIREEKGYTYSIYSTTEPMLYDGYFYIATEVGNEYKTLTKQEIYKEIGLLQNELVSETELKMVKNYLLGNVLTMMDGPFNIAEIIKSYVIEGVDYKEFNQIAATIQDVSAEKIRDLAQKYLKKEDLWEITVGER